MHPDYRAYSRYLVLPGSMSWRVPLPSTRPVRDRQSLHHFLHSKTTFRSVFHRFLPKLFRQNILAYGNDSGRRYSPIPWPLIAPDRKENLMLHQPIPSAPKKRKAQRSFAGPPRHHRSFPPVIAASRAPSLVSFPVTGCL